MTIDFWLASVMFGILMLPSSIYGVLSTRTEAYQPLIYVAKSGFEIRAIPIELVRNAYIVIEIPEPWPD